MNDFSMMLTTVNEGKHLSVESNELPQLDLSIGDCSVKDLLDITRFDLSFDVMRGLDESFVERFYSLSLEDKLKLSIADGTWNILKLFLFTFKPDDDVTEVEVNYKRVGALEKKVLLAVVINFDLLEVIPGDDSDELWVYFTSTKIKEKDIGIFSSPGFLKLLFKEKIHENRVFYVWVSENVKLLIENDVVDVSNHIEFFSKIFANEDYIQYSLSDLFKAAICKDERVFYGLANVRLCIDPFSKETNYSQWLKDSSKFMFLAYCRQEYLDTIESEEVSEFAARLKYFLDYNLLDDTFSQYSVKRNL
ncbi:hypothetical protein [Halomonas piscis]|uniref:hypothetical protein n=1 Tax=Halomonas piscis TaxID=3031727 RepID=UPI0028968952|nr:hypothetical protein [Halomonas piscis]